LELIRRRALQSHASFPQTVLAPQRELPKLEPNPLDARALGDLEKLGGRDFVRDIVAQFVADAAAVLASLTAAITSRDSKAFCEQAHALRSCAANVGAQNVYRMCLAWRDLDAQEIAASGSQYMQMLEAEFERVRGALAPMLQQGDGSGTDSEAA
jgi:two-component system, sensor histidine kinase RpfC